MKRALMAALAVAVCAQCTPLPSDPFQSLVVGVTTAGSLPNVDGFTITIDGAETRVVPVDGTATFTDLVPGDHTLELSGYGSNCTVAENPRVVTVVEGGVVEASFEVDCARIGLLLVQVTTTGTGVDVDGYIATVDGDGARSRAVAPNSAVVFDSLPEGQHLVALSDIDPNCTVVGPISGSNPRAVAVEGGGVAQLSFVVHCSGSPTGRLLVRTTTTGSALDADGYSARVDGDDALRQAVGPNGSVLFENLGAGEHLLELSDVAPNCTVVAPDPPENQQVVTVFEGQTTEASFRVACVGTGWLLVQTTTTGTAVDADGYTVTVDGDDAGAQAVGPNGSSAFQGLGSGEHVIDLSGVADNCDVAEPNPRLVTIAEGGVAEAQFTVSCVGTGELLVQATTTGSAVDADGYSVTLDGDSASAQVVGPNSSVSFAGLSAGEHEVTLDSVASNCTIAGTNPRVVTVAADATVRATFSVTCVGTGSLVVQATTTGSATDPDGYLATVDGNALAVGPNGSVLFEGLAAGTHTVLLSGVAGNCSVADPDPRTVTVAADATVQTTFAVTCDGQPPTPWGSLEVVVGTTGSNIDSDGYIATVDGGVASAAVGPNRSVLFDSLAAGPHEVALSDVASNCTVEPSDPQVVTVVGDATVQAAFDVTCTAPGWLVVTTTTTGTGLDPDGYTATVVGDGASSRAVGSNGSVLFPGLAAGPKTVTLSDVAPNCTVEPPNPRVVTVVADEAVQVTFAVTCDGPPLSSLEVVVGTTGNNIDADGYIVTLDGGTPSAAVGPNGSVLFESLSAVPHTVALSDVAPNCTVVGPNPQVVTVVADTTVQGAFAVTCTAPGWLVVTATTTGGSLDADGYIATIDGDAAGSQSVATNGSALFEGLEAGPHVVALSGVAAHCDVTSSNPQVVTVVADGVEEATFRVSCMDILPHGSIGVSVTTMGCDPDTDGFSVVLDGTVAKAVATSGTVIFDSVTVGDHSVHLTGVAGDCRVDSQNPQTAWVGEGTVTDVSFAVRCVDGDDPDPHWTSPSRPSASSPLQPSGRQSC